MGKRNKKNKGEDLKHPIPAVEETLLNNDKVNSKRKKKNDLQSNDEKTSKVDGPKMKHKKRNEDETHLNTSVDDIAQCSTESKIKTTKTETNDEEITKTTMTVSQNEKQQQKKKKKKKRKAKNDEGINNEDEAVDESEIDKFCDEVSPEDNVQYENWIELLEAKLKSGNKNTS